MKRPQVGSAHRPKRIVLRGHPQWRELFPHLKEIGVEVFVENNLHQIEEAFNDYLRFVQNRASKEQSHASSEQMAVERLFPAIAKWVNDRFGHIEIGDQEGHGFAARALDYGGLIFEENQSDSLAESMAALEKALAQWFRDEGVEIE